MAVQVARSRRPQGAVDGVYRFCVNWNGMLEPIELPKDATVGELVSVLRSGKYAKDSHKLLVFKGLLLRTPTTIAEGRLGCYFPLLPLLYPQTDILCPRVHAAGIRDGSVLHLLLNDDPYKGKPIYIKTFAGRLHTIECGPDFYIDDIKVASCVCCMSFSVSNVLGLLRISCTRRRIRALCCAVCLASSALTGFHVPAGGAELLSRRAACRENKARVRGASATAAAYPERV